jgi:hypothetical protein
MSTGSSGEGPFVLPMSLVDIIFSPLFTPLPATLNDAQLRVVQANFHHFTPNIPLFGIRVEQQPLIHRRFNYLPISRLYQCYHHQISLASRPFPFDNTHT